MKLTIFAAILSLNLLSACTTTGGPRHPTDDPANWPSYHLGRFGL